MLTVVGGASPWTGGSRSRSSSACRASCWSRRAGTCAGRRPRTCASRRAYATLNGTIAESVEGARTIDALGLGARRRARIDADQREAFAAESRTLYLRTVLFPGVDVSFVLPIVAALLWGAYLVSAGLPTVGAVTTIAVYALQLRHPIGELIYWLDEIQIGAASLARIIGVRARRAGPRAPGDASPAGEHVAAAGVRYAYREGHDVLHGIDLTLRPGERLAVVGPSGAGKSTLGRMLAGIHPPHRRRGHRRRRAAGRPAAGRPARARRAGHPGAPRVRRDARARTCGSPRRTPTTTSCARALAAVDALDWVDGAARRPGHRGRLRRR